MRLPIALAPVRYRLPHDVVVTPFLASLAVLQVFSEEPRRKYPLLQFHPLLPHQVVAGLGCDEPVQLEAEQGTHEEHAAIAILDVRGMHDGVHQEALRVDENVPLLAFDLLACIISMWVVRPSFSALFTLWLSMIAAVGDASRSALSRHST